jgi:hypothetical protein
MPSSIKMSGTTLRMIGASEIVETNFLNSERQSEMSEVPIDFKNEVRVTRASSPKK